MLNGAAPVVIEAVAQHTASMIFLHGLGDTAYGWAPEMRELSKRFHFMKFILPTAYHHELPQGN
jgi:predicted esterase